MFFSINFEENGSLTKFRTIVAALALKESNNNLIQRKYKATLSKL